MISLSTIEKRILTALAVVAMVWVLYSVRAALTPLAFSVALAYLCEPLVGKLAARGISRIVAVGFVCTALVLMVSLVLVIIVPMVVQEITLFVSELPLLLEDARRSWEPTLLRYHIVLPHSFSELTARVPVANLAERIANSAGLVLSWTITHVLSSVATMVGWFIVPVLAVYLMFDYPDLKEQARALIPPRLRPSAFPLLTEVDKMLSDFVRGQLLVMLIMGVLYAVCFTLAGVRLALPIGIVAGALSFIPYVGSGSALVLGLLMSIIAWSGFSGIVKVVAAYGFCQILEGFVVTPKIVGDRVGLTVVEVLVALLIFGEAFGFLGVLLAVPMAATLKILMRRAMARYEASSFYGINYVAPIDLQAMATQPAVSMIEGDVPPLKTDGLVAEASAEVENVEEGNATTKIPAIAVDDTIQIAHEKSETKE